MRLMGRLALLPLLVGCGRYAPATQGNLAALGQAIQKDMEKLGQKTKDVEDEVKDLAGFAQKVAPGYKKGDFKVRLPPGSTVLGADGKEYVLPQDAPSPPPAKGGVAAKPDPKAPDLAAKELELKRKELELRERELGFKKQVAEEAKKLLSPENLGAFLNSLKAALAPDGLDLKGHGPKRHEPPAVVVVPVAIQWPIYWYRYQYHYWY